MCHCKRKIDPQHDKTNKMSVRPAETQISLGIRPVWSESSLSAWRKLGSLATHWVHSEDSDQTGRMPKLIWVFAGGTLIFVGFVMSWLKWLFTYPNDNWARAWQNQPNDLCAEHLPVLSVFLVHLKKLWVSLGFHIHAMCASRRVHSKDWSDWADA